MNKRCVFNRSLSSSNSRIAERARLALADDAGNGDTTSLALIPKNSRAKAFIISNSRGVLCGLFEARAIFRGLCVKELKREGERIRAGEKIIFVEGNAREILARARTALNYLQVLSGIATATKNLASRFPNKIASLRKTHPCLTYSEKRAVKIGGGLTHRLNLGDGILIKKEHLALLGGGKNSIKKALSLASRYRDSHSLRVPIEIEVESFEQAVFAAEFARAKKVPDAIMLDNFSARDAKQTIQKIKSISPRVLIECSGGIDEKNAAAYVRAGADVISTSALTLRARPLDFHLLIRKIMG
ncbi:MAG: carboxylating nicotinate-nucleotide diphosphorylase [Candidatus Micrarchaeota archaeon]